MNKKYLFLGLGISIFSLNSCSIFHKNKVKYNAISSVTIPKKDSLSNKIKKYSDVITSKAITQKGLFTIHKVDEKYYFEIADSLLGRDILAVTRLSKSTPGAGNYGGEELGERMVYWQKGPNNNLFLKVSAQINLADSNTMISKAVISSNTDPIYAAFPIKAYSKDSTGTVIDLTDFILSDNPLLSFSSNGKKSYGLTTQNNDRSYIESVKSYPINTDISTVRTFTALPSTMTGAILPAVSESGFVTLGINCSFLLMPKEPMKKRFYDARVGYFGSAFYKYSDDQQRVETESFIHRWRLEPKDEDLEKYKRGELVEPKKQIVYYIDPATPKKWRSYLIAGINDWQKAFEQAGFKNAIVGKEWPENDTTMSLNDARYSVVRYFASPIQNAYGPNIADPRSGEILESHIGWYHNVMSLVHDWYMIQCGAVDARARTNVFDDSLMGQLIRFVSSHEIGHTLGLKHNMGSSSTVPVEKLRDKKWLAVYGHTPSIMDYARFNYVAQPEDSIPENGLFPRINDYDKWAIQWGYKNIYANKSEEDEKLYYSQLIKDSLAANPRLWFGGEGRDFDPRSQTEDLGDDAVTASLYGIKNLKRIVPQLINWTKENGKGYTNLSLMYKAAVGQYEKYAFHVVKYLGGLEVTPKTYDQSGPVFQPTSLIKQKRAIKYLNDQVFKTPNWLLNKDILDKIEPNYNATQVEKVQEQVIASATSEGRLFRVMANYQNSGGNAYSPQDWLNDLKNGIFAEMNNADSIDYYRRGMQKRYVGSIITMYNKHFAIQGSVDNIIASLSPVEVLYYSDLKPLALNHLKQLYKDISKVIPKYKDGVSKQHLEYLKKMLEEILKESPIPGLAY